MESLIVQAKTRRPNDLTNRPGVQSSWSMNERSNSLLTAHQACRGGFVGRHLTSDTCSVDELSIRERIEQPSGGIVQHRQPVWCSTRRWVAREFPEPGGVRVESVSAVGLWPAKPLHRQPPPRSIAWASHSQSSTRALSRGPSVEFQRVRPQSNHEVGTRDRGGRKQNPSLCRRIEIDRRTSTQATRKPDQTSPRTIVKTSIAATVAGESRTSQGFAGQLLHPAVPGSKKRALPSPATTTVQP